ncbi:MAG: GAF domain-containing protein [Syntrophales bacterium]
MDEHADILKTNEEIAKKINKIEKLLPSFLNAKDLFEKLLIQIEEEFSIPFVWISVATETDLASLIHLLRASHIIKERLNIIDRVTFLNVIGESTKPILVNNDLKPFYKLLPRKKKFFIKSVAIAPIIVNNEIIGSINLGDHSNLRYQPGMDTGLLEKLVSNVSDCLSNFMTCEKEASKQ